MIPRPSGLKTLSIAMTLIFAAGAFSADGARIVGESRRTVQRFAEAAQLEQDGRIHSAVDLYLSILNENGADLIPLDSAAQHLLPARWIAHRRLAGNDKLLETFRDRVAGPAKKLLTNGIAARDPKLLEQLVETLFCSRESETALHWLGDWACERGDFSAAQQYWMKLVPGPMPGALTFPNPTGDSALPAAKILLSRLLAGDRNGISDEIAKIEQRHPNFTVTLAGRTGRVGDVIRELAAVRDMALKRDSLPTSRMATFAHDPARNGFVRGPMPIPEPTWNNTPILLPESARESDAGSVQRPLLSAEILGQFPVISQDHVLVADARRIHAYDLASGRLTAQFDLKANVEDLPLAMRERDARFTLTAAGDDVYARLGQPRIRGDRIDGESYIVALQFRPQAEEPLRLRWILPANRLDQAVHTSFESSPIIHDGKLFVAATRFDGNRATTEIACYDPQRPTPQLIWRQDVLETGPDAANRSRHLLLCAADGVIVCGPYNGAIVALDSSNGSRAWAYRYPVSVSDRSRSAPRPPTLNPCVAADSRLYAAPDDSDRLIALDLATGTPLWECGPIEDGQILGVTADKLVFQTGGIVSGLRAIDASNGKLLPNWGYAVFGSDAAAPLGRGLVFDDCVCWPTRADGVKLLRLDGLPEMTPAAFRSLPGGNIIHGDGYFVIAAQNRLHVLATSPSPGAETNREVP